jgi:isopenicillin N synthase-like dioxygenase
MAAKSLPEVDHFIHVKPTKEKLDFADLEVLDFSLYDDGPTSRKILADQVHQAMSTHGFFVILNHGISEEVITRQVNIGHTILSRTPQEEKNRLKADILGKGEYPGFKPRGHWKVDGGAPDRIENFNINRNMSLHQQPAALEPYREEIQAVVDKIHKDILYKIWTLFGMALELNDEEFFVKAHSYEKHDESWARWMEYYHDPDEENGKSLWLQGHQDLTSLSLLFSQPMSNLQVRDYADSSQWKYVRYIPGAIIVNAGEILMWWTGDYFKAAIHRVIEPPRDQQGFDRSGFFYFTVPNDDVVINTLLEESPVLLKAGVKRWFKDGEAPTSKEWVNNRIRATGQKTLFANRDEKTEQQKIGSVTTTWYK